MKILIINYRYFVSGGPERYMFNLMNLLKSKGHEVIPFSINYSKNLKTDYAKYFVSPLSSIDEVYFKEQKLSFASIIKTLERSFYSKEVYDNLQRLIKDTKPDFAIVLHYLKKLSPSILTVLNDNYVPFVVRLSDFLMICPNAHLLREEKICELCINKGLFNSVKYKCVQNSYSASLIYYLSMHYHKGKKYFDKVKYFIVPSKFTISKMIQAGFNHNRLIHLPTFVQIPTSKNKPKKKKQIVFVGRLVRSKGVHILLEAIRYLKNNGSNDFECLIVGDGDNHYIKELKEFVINNQLVNVFFLGRLNKVEIDFKISESSFSIIPSIWYDNLPNTALESMALGIPVIAPNHGSFLELIGEGKTGLLYEPGNFIDLSEKIKMLFENPKLIEEFGQNARNIINNVYNEEHHYKILLNIIKRMTNYG